MGLNHEENIAVADFGGYLQGKFRPFFAPLVRIVQPRSISGKRESFGKALESATRSQHSHTLDYVSGSVVSIAW
jgi:hypothetical protein